MRFARHAFSLTELVVVIVILAIIATIALPRLGRAASSASDAGLRQDLAIMRSALETYRAEHNGDAPDLADLPDALLAYTDGQGNTNATATSVFVYGPYLATIPPQKVGAKAGETGIAAADAAGIGWIYDESTGEITANATGSDAKGVDYSNY